MNNIPQYVKIKNYIKENIKQGKINPGGKIPSEKELGDIFNVSRITATTAIRDLVNEGLVYRIQGKGTFVTEKNFEDIRKHRFYGFENDSSLTKGQHKTLSKSKIKAHGELCEKMDISKDEEVFEIVRTKIINEKVNALEYVYLPVKYYLSLDIEKSEINLIHDMVEEYCFLKQKRAKIYIEPIISGKREEELMKIKRNSPVLLWEKITFSEEEKIVEYSKNIINSDLYKFYMDLDLN
ncbi:MAG: GntR family transcriptional regulator [Eubacteriales bacterium]